MLKNYMLLLLLSLTAFSSLKAAEPYRQVLVTLPSYRTIIEKIAGDTVTIDLLDLSETMELSPAELKDAGEADIWFCNKREVSEHSIAQALKQQNPNMEIIDLGKGISMSKAEDDEEDDDDEEDEGGESLCLDFKELQIEVKWIADALIRHYPEHKQSYQEALDQLNQNFNTLEVLRQSSVEKIKAEIEAVHQKNNSRSSFFNWFKSKPK